MVMQQIANLYYMKDGSKGSSPFHSANGRVSQGQAMRVKASSILVPSTIFILTLLLGGCRIDEYELQKLCIRKHGSPFMENDKFKSCDFKENVHRFNFKKETD